MTAENRAAAASAKESRRFFEKQLAGEQPLSWETAGQLYEMAAGLFSIEPWEFVDDYELILIPDTESGEICYCSIMGALGEVFSLQVYVGAESYRFFRRILNAEAITPGDFFAAIQGVSVEFVRAREQTLPDRELLDALGHSNKRGLRAPIFRANRPGYHPWYVTEGEGRMLLRCMRGVLAFCSYLLEETEDIDYWEKDDVFPLLISSPDDTTHKHFEIRMAEAPEPPVASPRAADLDENLISAILRQNLPRHGVFEVDHFFSGAKIGEKNERKACPSVVLLIDAESGFAFQPELARPEQSIGQFLVAAVLNSIRDAQLVPHEVRVRNKEFKILLSTLAERMKFEVRVTKSLPALDHFKESLLVMMGDLKAFPAR